MFCTKCGKQIPDDSKFCPYCGNPAETPENMQKRVDKPTPYIYHNTKLRPLLLAMNAGISARPNNIRIISIVILYTSVTGLLYPFLQHRLPQDHFERPSRMYHLYNGFRIF